MSPAPRQLTLDSLVVASPDQVSSDLGEETVLLSMTDARYYGLQGVGGQVWAAIATPARVSEVCAAIAREYDAPLADVERDVLAFLRDLMQRGLVELRNAP